MGGTEDEVGRRRKKSGHGFGLRIGRRRELGDEVVEVIEGRYGPQSPL